MAALFQAPLDSHDVCSSRFTPIKLVQVGPLLVINGGCTCYNYSYNYSYNPYRWPNINVQLESKKLILIGVFFYPMYKTGSKRAHLFRISSLGLLWQPPWVLLWWPWECTHIVGLFYPNIIWWTWHSMPQSIAKYIDIYIYVNAQ